jgi:hypothetical protein
MVDVSYIIFIPVVCLVIRINDPQAVYNNANTAIMFQAEGNEEL